VLYRLANLRIFERYGNEPWRYSDCAAEHSVDLATGRTGPVAVDADAALKGGAK